MEIFLLLVLLAKQVSEITQKIGYTSMTNNHCANSNISARALTKARQIFSDKLLHVREVYAIQT